MARSAKLAPEGFDSLRLSLTVTMNMETLTFFLAIGSGFAASLATAALTRRRWVALVVGWVVSAAILCAGLGP